MRLHVYDEESTVTRQMRIGDLVIAKAMFPNGPSCTRVGTPSASVAMRGCSTRVSILRLTVVLLVFLKTVEAAGYLTCPKVCSCLGNMVDCSKKRLKRIPDDLPDWVQTLDISLNSIAHVGNGDFKGFNHLEEINLSGNKMTVFDANVLRQLPAVRTLKLSHNNLSQMPDVSWPVNITHLHLGHNVISDVNASSFRNLDGLRVIDLSFNGLTRLGNGTLPPQLRNLHHLFLMDNKIEVIERGAFENLLSLEWLKLNRNRMTSLPPNIFSRLQKLKYLELNQNRLKKIESLRFQGLGNLLSLRLKRNQLSELMDGAFFGLLKIETLQLDYNNLSKINSGFLFGLETMKHLFMTHNVINQIEPDSWSSCKRLSELDLSHNQLSAVTDTMFARLESLQTLRLNQNRISYIAEHAFRDLIALKTLDLSHNRLSSTLEDAHSVFTSLSSLTRLSLDGNDIKSIAKHTFKGLSHLKQLNLLGNAITSVQDNAFEPLKNLDLLRLNSTSLLCDCLLSWLPIWLRGTGFQLNVHGQCAHPDSLRGLSIFDVDGSNFKCDDFPKPIIRKDPQSQVALKDSTLNLTCVAATSSNSQLKIDWKKDHTVLSNALVETTARSNNVDGLVEYTSRMMIRPVKNEHAGYYQCVVSNALGTSYSAKAEITVGVFPHFLKIPSDVTVKAGSTARLDCAASGQPAPEIAWQKDGGDDFPAARERRMHVMPSDDVFFIVEVKSEDQGLYTCTAKNHAGMVKANATLTVLQTPSFSKTSKEKFAAEGETAVLECMSSRPGVRPRLEWLKDGRPLSFSSRHYFAGDGQLLVITQTQPSDSGEYTCIMTNPLGSERATLHFTVANGVHVKDKALVSDGASSTDSMTRIGLIVIASVVCIVGTSLVWVIVIYRLRLKRDVWRSAKRHHLCKLLNSPFHLAGDGAVIGEHSTSILCGHSRQSAAAAAGRYSPAPHGSKRLMPDPNDKCSPSMDFYMYNSCRCQDSGCFCTDSKSNEKSSHLHLPTADDVVPDSPRTCWFPQLNDCQQQRPTLSMPQLIANADQPDNVTDAHSLANTVLPKTGAQQSPVGARVSTSACSGWHTASDSDLSLVGNRCHPCKNNHSLSCQKLRGQPRRAAVPSHLTKFDAGDCSGVTQDPVSLVKSGQCDSIHEQCTAVRASATPVCVEL